MMNDSNETTCDEESDCENSPSILSHWRENCETNGEEDVIKKFDICNFSSQEMHPGQGDRGIKRKCASETREAVESFQGGKSHFHEDEKLLKHLLNKVEKFVKDRESEPRGHSSRSNHLKTAKTQLAEIQKRLMKLHRSNQEERKAILPRDIAESQSLCDNDKAAIVELARKQRQLLDSFKMYKSLSHRVKSIEASCNAGHFKISHKNKPSLHNATTLDPTRASEGEGSIENPNNPQTFRRDTEVKRFSGVKLITTKEALMSLLHKCQVVRISPEEILSPVQRGLHGDFWEDEEFELTNVGILNGRWSR